MTNISYAQVETNRYGTYSVGGYTYTNSPISYGPQNPNSNVPRIVCPLNYTIKGNSCTPNQKTCKSGMIVNFYEECLKTCWGGSLDGKQIQENLNCPERVVETQVYNTSNANAVYSNSGVRVCTSGNLSSVTGRCDKVCPSGAVIAESETCPSQTKTCNNGKVISYNSVCTRICPNGSEVNESVDCFTNGDITISTSPATSINVNSAKLAGIVIMNSSDVGISYFEYSQMPNSQDVIRTNSANLNGYFKYNLTNVIEGLNPNTKYYYRSVLVVNGRTYKGDFLNFTTLSNDYAKNKIIKMSPPAITVTPKVKTDNNQDAPAILKKEEAKLSANQSSKTKSLEDTSKEVAKSSSNQDAKAMALAVTRVSDKMAAGEDVSYKISYGNEEEVDLKNLEFKIVTPSNLKFVSATIGKYDDETRELVIQSDEISAGRNGEILITYRVEENVIVGTNLIITVKTSYEYEKNGELIIEDNSSYIISTVSSGIDKTVNDSNGIFSNMLFKILFILLLFLLLYIIGKKLYNERAIVALRNKILSGRSSSSEAH